MTTLEEQITAKRAELDQARAAAERHWNTPAGNSRQRGKQHAIRVDSHVKRSAANHRLLARLTSELAALERRATEPEPTPLDLGRLPYAQFIRTDLGWWEVVKVNRKTVKVVNTPGMDDLIPIRKILEIRERTAASAAEPEPYLCGWRTDTVLEPTGEPR